MASCSPPSTPSVAPAPSAASAVTDALESAGRSLARRAVAAPSRRPELADQRKLQDALADKPGVTALGSATTAAVALKFAGRFRKLGFLAKRTPYFLIATAVPALIAFGHPRRPEQLGMVAAHLSHRAQAEGVEPDIERVRRRGPIVSYRPVDPNREAQPRCPGAAVAPPGVPGSTAIHERAFAHRPTRRPGDGGRRVDTSARPGLDRHGDQACAWRPRAPRCFGRADRRAVGEQHIGQHVGLDVRHLRDVHDQVVEIEVAMAISRSLDEAVGVDDQRRPHRDRHVAGGLGDEVDAEQRVPASGQRPHRAARPAHDGQQVTAVA